MGPIVQGVVLDVHTSGDYLPTAHVHALTRPFPAISLTLPTDLRTAGGVQDSVRPWQHTPAFVAQAAARLRTASPLPMEAEVFVEDLVGAYREEIVARRFARSPTSVNELEDQVLVPAALGRSDLVRDGLAFARSFAAGWPPGSLELWGRGDDWLEVLAEQAAHPEVIEATVEDEVRVHKLAALPFVPLG
ncbi:MAG TPA: hypothetical protein VFJ85_18440 [Acidimicrobiales bacterium]|nr:hypothetical protein [Acidimicrobiales bacterium]